MKPNRVNTICSAACVALIAAFGLLGRQSAWTSDLSNKSASPIAAEFDLVAIEGAHISSEAMRGHVVVLDFWATWCGPCLTEIDDYNALQREFGDRGVRVLGVTLESGTAEETAAFAHERGIEYPLAMGDELVSERFGPFWGYPTTLLIDRDWRVRRAWLGAGSRKHRELRAAVEALVAERP